MRPRYETCSLFLRLFDLRSRHEFRRTDGPHPSHGTRRKRADRSPSRRESVGRGFNMDGDPVAYRRTALLPTRLWRRFLAQVPRMDSRGKDVLAWNLRGFSCLQRHGQPRTTVGLPRRLVVVEPAQQNYPPQRIILPPTPHSPAVPAGSCPRYRRCSTRPVRSEPRRFGLPSKTGWPCSGASHRGDGGFSPSLVH